MQSYIGTILRYPRFSLLLFVLFCFVLHTSFFCLLCSYGSPADGDLSWTLEHSPSCITFSQVTGASVPRATFAPNSWTGVGTRASTERSKWKLTRWKSRIPAVRACAVRWCTTIPTRRKAKWNGRPMRTDSTRSRFRFPMAPNMATFAWVPSFSCEKRTLWTIRV